MHQVQEHALLNTSMKHSIETSIHITYMLSTIASAWCAPKSMVSEVVLNQERKELVWRQNEAANALREQDMSAMLKYVLDS